MLFVFVGFYINWVLSLLLYFILYLMIISSYALAFPGTKCYSKGILKYQKAENIAKESFKNIKSISIFGKEEEQINLFNDKLKQSIYKLKRRVFFIGISFSLILSIIYIIYFIIYIMGNKYINDGILKGGDMVAITLFILTISNSNERDDYSKKYIEEVGEIIKKFNNSTHHYFTKNNNMKAKDDEKQKKQIHGDIDIFDCHLQPGKIVAFVGNYSTDYSHIHYFILNENDIIKVKIDGQDIKDYNIHDLHSQIGVVSEQIFLFNDTIAENISITCPNATQQQIENVAKLVNAHEFISRLPKGYQTVIRGNDDDDDNNNNNNNIYK